MTIKYKFNKSSEARDCVVESVNLILIEEIISGKLTFYNSNELKEHFKNSNFNLEFIAESSIDDVLMKEWIGEWNVLFNPLTNYFYKKTPKLNSNWTFKIE